MAINAPPITTRALNRALLARQLLLAASPLSPLAAISHLLGLQAQLPNPPYVGLFTRLARFERDALTGLIETGQVVRAPGQRSTLHLFTAADHQLFRRTLQPALERGLRSFHGRWLEGVDPAPLLATAREALAASPLSTGELKALLQPLAPDTSADALAYLVRTRLPLVQVAPAGTWGSGAAARYALAEQVLGPADAPAPLSALFRRYLAAYGPASIADFQFYTGMTRLDAALKPHLAGLLSFTGPDGRSLYDLPEAPRPPEDTPAPLRLVPEYDNLVIAHKDRSRILPDAHYRQVFLSAARVLGTVLVDGFAAASWRVRVTASQATLTIAPFDTGLPAATRARLEAEARRMLGFIAPDAPAHQVEMRID